MADSLDETVSHTVSYLSHCITGIYNERITKTDRLTVLSRIRVFAVA